MYQKHVFLSSCAVCLSLNNPTPYLEMGYFLPFFYTENAANIHLSKVISERKKSISFHLVCADDIEMNFCLNLCIYMDNSLVVIWKSFLILFVFG